MDKLSPRQTNRFKRLIAFLRRRREQTVPTSWVDKPPADLDIVLRESRRHGRPAAPAPCGSSPRCNSPRPVFAGAGELSVADT
jgi:hypothetical protein